MSVIHLLATEDIMDHLAPRYAWHWPGFTVHLDRLNHWVESIFGFNPDFTTHVMMLLTAAAVCLAFFLLAARQKGDVPTGVRNLLEPMLVYVADEMVYPWFPTRKEAERFLPYHWALFFFILACNLIGLLPSPFGISATGNWNVTGALAVLTLLIGISAGIVKKGGFGYIAGLIPKGVHWVLWPLLYIVEILGLLSRHLALMIRLFANMTGGHAILAVFALWLSLTPAFLPFRLLQGTGSVVMTCFEILIAFIQAYVFTILSAIYIGLAVAEEH